jgi:hypothetical protein
MMTGKTEKAKTRIATLSMHSLLERHHLDASEPCDGERLVVGKRPLGGRQHGSAEQQGSL